MASISLLTLLLACEGSVDSTDTSPTDTSAEDSGGQDSGGEDSGTQDSDPADDTGDTGGEDTGGIVVEDCVGLSGAPEIVCLANNFLATLDSSQLATATYDFSDSTEKTLWSNLPLGASGRAGLAHGDLDSENKEALAAFAQALLSDEGYEDYVGILAADDYLGTLSGGGGGPGGGGGGGGMYTSDEAVVAFYGTPATSGSWMVQLGNHHLAYNVTFVDGVGYPTPSHQASEPKETFTYDGSSYAPVVEEGQAFVDLMDSLSSSQLSAAKLSQSFGDILLGPVEYGTGSMSQVVYPTGSARGGVLISELSADQQALAIAAMEQWVSDFNDEAVSAELLAAYTTSAALADTYVAWAGGSSPDIETNGTYFRIDGPRVWIEVACQNGVVIQGQTHFHMIYRDKSMDYGAEL